MHARAQYSESVLNLLSNCQSNNHSQTLLGHLRKQIVSEYGKIIANLYFPPPIQTL
jgi:hypothetical protein